MRQSEFIKHAEKAMESILRSVDGLSPSAEVTSVTITDRSGFHNEPDLDAVSGETAMPKKVWRPSLHAIIKIKATMVVATDENNGRITANTPGL